MNKIQLVMNLKEIEGFEMICTDNDKATIVYDVRNQTYLIMLHREGLLFHTIIIPEHANDVTSINTIEHLGNLNFYIEFNQELTENDKILFTTTKLNDISTRIELTLESDFGEPYIKNDTIYNLSIDIAKYMDDHKDEFSEMYDISIGLALKDHQVLLPDYILTDAAVVNDKLTFNLKINNPEMINSIKSYKLVDHIILIDRQFTEYYNDLQMVFKPSFVFTFKKDLNNSSIVNTLYFNSNRLPESM